MDERKEEVGFLTQDEVTRLALQRFEQRFGNQKIWTGADRFLWEQVEGLINISYLSATGINQISEKERLTVLQEQLTVSMTEAAEKLVNESYLTGFLAGRRMLNESN